MKNIKFNCIMYAIITIINYLLFAWDITYNPDMTSWLWLGNALFFGWLFTFNYKNIKITYKHYVELTIGE